MKKTLTLLLGFGAFFFFFPRASASLTIAVNPSLSFPSAPLSTTIDQVRTVFSTITVTDDRAGSPGWQVTAVSSHLTRIAPPLTVAGNNSTVSSGGSYDGTFGVSAPWKSYLLTITTSGPVGTATFNVSGAETQTNLTTGALVSIGTKGARADFNIANYVVNDQWQIAVDVFPYTDITVTPGNITANSGSLTGVSAGSAGALTGTGTSSNAKTLMSASAGNGTGSYTQTSAIDLLLHKNSQKGSFTGVCTFTII